MYLLRIKIVDNNRKGRFQKEVYLVREWPRCCSISRAQRHRGVATLDFHISKGAETNILLAVILNVNTFKNA